MKASTQVFVGIGIISFMLMPALAYGGFVGDPMALSKGWSSWSKAPTERDVEVSTSTPGDNAGAAAEVILFGSGLTRFSTNSPGLNADDHQGASIASGIGSDEEESRNRRRRRRRRHNNDDPTNPTPEPATVMLLASGVLAAGAVRGLRGRNMASSDLEG